MPVVEALKPDQVGLIAQIDRTEHIGTLYEVEAGELTAQVADIHVPRWFSDGAGPHSVQSYIDDLTPIVQRGATLLGVFDHDQLAGIAIIEERFEADMAWLVFLHVSNGYRRHGIGTALWTEAVARARNAGATSMYVSATPSESAVGFYLDRGCELVPRPHPLLYAEEPEDIHLIAHLQ
jgi:ribosomal protein S18 acetylase RimI-like enzyme